MDDAGRGLKGEGQWVDAHARIPRQMICMHHKVAISSPLHRWRVLCRAVARIVWGALAWRRIPERSCMGGDRDIKPGSQVHRVFVLQVPDHLQDEAFPGSLIEVDGYQRTDELLMKWGCQGSPRIARVLQTGGRGSLPAALEATKEGN